MDTQAEVEKMVKEIGALALPVAEQHAALETAIAAECKAEALVLERAIALVKPALLALGSKIKRRDDSTSGRNGCNPVEEIEYHPKRGIKLAGGVERERDGTGNRGKYCGEALYLLTTGELAVVEFHGTWSNWQGEWDRLSSTLTVVTPEQVAEEWELLPIVAMLTKQLKSQVEGNAKQQTAAAIERSARLHALAALL